MNRLNLTLATMACLVLAACSSTGRSDPMTTTSTPPASMADDPLLKLLWPQMVKYDDPFDPQEKKQVEELVTSWFQNSVKTEYDVLDERSVIIKGDSQWSALEFDVVLGLNDAHIETSAKHPPLPELQDFPPPHDRHDKSFQGWGKQEGHTSNWSSNTYEVTAPRPAVIAAVYLYGVLPGHRSILTLFELKPTLGQG